MLSFALWKGRERAKKARKAHTLSPQKAGKAPHLEPPFVTPPFLRVAFPTFRLLINSCVFFDRVKLIETD